MSSPRAAFWALVRMPARLAFRRSLNRRSFSLPVGAPRLSYGGVLPRTPDVIVAGGRVKLKELDRVFPESESFNLLYLVSSALPAHAPELVRWARSRGARLVWNQNGVAFPAWAGSRCAETNEPLAELRKLADFVIYQSEFCRVSADRFLGPVSSSSRVLFNPVDLAAFSPALDPAPAKPWRLLTAGTHYQPWRVIGPLEVLARLRDAGHAVHLTIAGELRWPGAQSEVQEVVSRLHVADSVSFRPAFTQAEAVAMYRAAHLLLHPKYHDPCPTVVIEALACGVPVIGSRSGGMPELVGEDGGELIDVPLSWEKPSAPDPKRVAEAVVRLTDDWPAHSRAARTRAERLFAAETWVAEHRRIFEQVLAA
ncbi:MAG TPA: glycosyltransferase family 4 protein [Chthoniobacteraceae bacterium]|jgi:glycosyltransferase involved in cell wall biosynthesis